MNIDIERLKEIVNNGVAKLTETDKEFITNTCINLGLPFRKTNCKNCYIDMAVAIYRNFAKPKNELSIKPDVDIYFNGMRINCVVVDTPKKVESVMKLGLPKKYVNFPGDENNE